jgi:hypothetical protein
VYDPLYDVLHSLWHVLAGLAFLLTGFLFDHLRKDETRAADTEHEDLHAVVAQLRLQLCEAEARAHPTLRVRASPAR